MSSSDDDQPLSKRFRASALITTKMKAVKTSQSPSQGNRTGLRARPARTRVLEDLPSDTDEDQREEAEPKPEEEEPTLPPISLSQALPSPDKRIQISSQTTLAGDVPTCLPLLVPDRLPSNKYLLELGPVRRPDGHAKALDLSGDSGAVGRIQFVKQDGLESFQIDLKGVGRMHCMYLYRVPQ